MASVPDARLTPDALLERRDKTQDGWATLR